MKQCFNPNWGEETLEVDYHMFAPDGYCIYCGTKNEKENKMKLHIGCGKRDFGIDWIHIDGEDYPHIKYKNIEILPWNDNTVDLIYASHVIEYFDREEVSRVLKEWYRVLVPGGILRLAVPDFNAMVKLYMSAEHPLDSFLGPLYGKMKMGKNDIYHKTVYDMPSLVEVLKEAGFKDFHAWDWRKVDHGEFDDHSQAYIPHMNKESGTLISLNLEAIK